MADENKPTENNENDDASNENEPVATDDTVASNSDDSTETVEAEIVSDEELAETASEEEPIDVDPVETNEDDDATDNEEDSNGGGLMGPFAIIVGILAVVAVLFVLLNRQDENTSAGTERPAIVSRPIEENAAPSPAPAADDEAADEMAEVVEAPAEPVSAPANEMVAEETAASEEGTSNLLARAAEKSAARRAELEAQSADIQDVVEETTDAIEDVAEAVGEQAETIAEDAVEELVENTEDLVSDVVETVEEAPSAAAQIIADAVSGNVSEEADTPVTEEVTPDASSTDEVPAEETIVEQAPVVAETTDTEAQTEAEVAETPADVTATDVASNVLPVDETTAESANNGVQPTTAIGVEEFEAQLDDIKSDVKATVLAETEEKLNQTEEKLSQQLQETDREVKAIRSELTEQQREANERLEAINTRLENIQTTELTEARTTSLLLALSELSDNVEAGDPFARELDTVEQIAPNTRPLAMLRRYADNGLPTTTDLRNQYQEAARKALSSAKRENAEGPMERFMANLSGLFTVRKVGNVEGDSTSAIIARAEANLEDNNLQSALQELRALQGSAREAFAPWISAAEAKVEAQRRIETFEDAVRSRAG